MHDSRSAWRVISISDSSFVNAMAIHPGNISAMAAPKVVMPSPTPTDIQKALRRRSNWSAP